MTEKNICLNCINLKFVTIKKVEDGLAKLDRSIAICAKRVFDTALADALPIVTVCDFFEAKGEGFINS